MLPWKLSNVVLLLLSAGLISSTAATEGTGHHIGLPWGAPPNCMVGMDATKAKDIHWYQHWQDGRVPSLDKLGMQYVPSFWGPSKWDKWEAVKAELRKGPKPQYMLAFNEPDVQGQADLGPAAAARLWMKELKPWADKGVQVGAPQVCWNMQWLESFMKQCKRLGCNISFMPLHWYGSYRDFDKFTKWISSVHQEYGLPIWITEYGITQASNPSQQDVKNFHMRAVKWMQSTGYVERSAWLGGFPVNDKPDPYPTNLGAYFNNDGSARDLLWWAATDSGYSGPIRRDGDADVDIVERSEQLAEPKHDGEKVHGHRGGHHRHAAHKHVDDEVKGEHYYDENHCDYKCQLREQSIEKHHRKKKGIVMLDEKNVCIEAPAKLNKDERHKLAVCLRHAGLSPQVSNRTHTKTSASP